ncbi:MAG TPA: hypothetical protein VK894_02825 [Jiangellales bacterium]|nr:hypothetical protein [Jiangellales bacterium]
MRSRLLDVTALPAQEPSPAPSPRIIDESLVSAGPVALLVVVLLGITLVLLIRNMNKQLHRVDFDESGETDQERMRGDDEPPR